MRGRATGAVALTFTLAAVGAACGGGSRRAAAPASPSESTAGGASPSRATPAPAPTPAPSPEAATSTTAPVARVTGGQPCGAGARPPAVYDHVVWIWMENHSYGQVIGNPRAPYETSLTQQCGTATQYSSVGGPSLPNYIGATSGGTQGIADDAPPSAHPVSADNLFREVRESGRTERSYQENMPGSCALGSSGRYAVKHNPAAYYVGPGDREACGSDDVPLGGDQSGTLASDVANGTLPAFSFITPDLCHDTHDCSVAAGDSWLQQWLPRILAGPDYQAGRTAIFVVWDEYSLMPNIVISPTTPAGTVSGLQVDHYSLLRTTEEMLGLPDLLGRAASASSLRAAFHI